MRNGSTGRGLGLKVALGGAGLAAGAIIASAFAANAATTTGSGNTASHGSAATSAPANPMHGRPSANPTHGRPPANAQGAQPVRNDETAVSAAVAAKLKAAAVKAVPGGSVYRVETDSGDAAYEAHMTKSDGPDVTVKFDKDLNVTGVEAGMGD